MWLHTTLEDPWPHYMILEVSWDGLWTLSFGLSQSHGHGSWLMHEVQPSHQIREENNPILCEWCYVVHWKKFYHGQNGWYVFQSPNIMRQYFHRPLKLAKTTQMTPIYMKGTSLACNYPRKWEAAAATKVRESSVWEKDVNPLFMSELGFDNWFEHKQLKCKKMFVRVCFCVCVYINMNIYIYCIYGAIHGWGTTFGRLTENGLFWITSHAWYA